MALSSSWLNSFTTIICIYQKHVFYFCYKKYFKIENTSSIFLIHVLLENAMMKFHKKIPNDVMTSFFFTENLQIFRSFFEGWAWVNFTQCRRFHLGFASMNIFGSISFFFRPCKPKQRNVSVTSEETFTFLEDFM